MLHRLATPMVLLCCWSLVQLAGAQSFVPQTIVFEGAPEYSQQQLLAASGLQAGRAVTQAELDRATERLGDQGVFSDVSYQSAGATLTFSLKPADAQQMQAAQFTNLVVFEPAELLAGVERRVPLFNGHVPSSGPMQQRVERALEAMLKEKGITARVDSIRTRDGRMDFAIASPPVQVGSLEVKGAEWSTVPALAAVRDRVVGSDYSDESSGDGLRESLLAAYRDSGYLDAAVTGEPHGPVEVEGDHIVVPLKARADPGPMYTIRQLDLPAAVPGVTAQEIAAAAQVRQGGSASRVLVLATAARLKALYAGHGYLDAASSVEPAKDAATHTLAYTFTVQPGEIYRMRALEMRGLSEAQTKGARAAWKLATGSVFESRELTAFEHQGAGAKLCDGSPAEVNLSPERTAHVVDVVLSCAGSYSSGNP